MARRGSTLTLFLDSSVVFTAVNSPFGGSAKLFTLPEVQLIVSKVVLTEVERNVKNKLTQLHIERFFTLAKNLTIITQLPSRELIERAQKVIVPKDAVILAEAKRVNPQYLVTLDKKHFFTTQVKTYIKPTIIASPKMIIDMLDNLAVKKRRALHAKRIRNELIKINSKTGRVPGSDLDEDIRKALDEADLD